MTHTHATPAAANRNRLAAVFFVTLGVFVFELIGGIAANSLALIADAGHLLTDVAGIGLTLVAIWFAGRPANLNRSYGLMRLEILAAVVNAMLLFAVAAYVLVEAWRRWNAPPEVASGLMLVVAVIGLLANGVSLVVLHNAQRESLPMRGAYLEVMGDLVGSVAVIVAAILITVTGQVRADAIASVFIGLLILPRTWALLKEAVDVLLEASPKGIDLGEVRSHILEAPGVADVHDLHAWTITSGVNVVSAHVVLEADASPPAVLDYLCGCLSGDFDIEHSTFQLETSDRRRLETAHHA
ncbi:MAG TPA: cation diffusion facilitator family transporter [Candidatus Limnocylindrales bacterium]